MFGNACKKKKKHKINVINKLKKNKKKKKQSLCNKSVQRSKKKKKISCARVGPCQLSVLYSIVYIF